MQITREKDKTWPYFVCTPSLLIVLTGSQHTCTICLSLLPLLAHSLRFFLYDFCPYVSVPCWFWLDLGLLTSLSVLIVLVLLELCCLSYTKVIHHLWQVEASFVKVGDRRCHCSIHSVCSHMDCLQTLCPNLTIQTLICDLCPSMLNPLQKAGVWHSFIDRPYSSSYIYREWCPDVVFVAWWILSVFDSFVVKAPRIGSLWALLMLWTLIWWQAMKERCHDCLFHAVTIPQILHDCISVIRLQDVACVSSECTIATPTKTFLLGFFPQSSPHPFITVVHTF